MAHTPGPWKVFRGGNFTEVWADAGKPGTQCRPSRFLVADVNYRQSDVGNNTPEQSQINAYLIAAAPELYESLFTLSSLLWELYPTEIGGYQHSEEYRAVHNALAKAKKSLAKAEGK